MAFRLAIYFRPKEEFFCLWPNWLCHSPSLTCNLLGEIKRKKSAGTWTLTSHLRLVPRYEYVQFGINRPIRLRDLMLQPRKLTNFEKSALLSWIPSTQVMCLAVTPLDSDLQWRIPTTLPTLIGICIRESPRCPSSSRLERCNPLCYKFRLASNHEAIRSATVRLCSSHLCCPPLAATFHATL
jgi:hypothetical protein